MDRFTRVLAGLLGRTAGLLPAARRDWAEAVLAEAGEVRAGAARVAWLGGGLWMVAREAVMGRVIRVLAFAVAAAGVVWIGWPGASSNSATPVNRVYAVGTVALLAVLPWVVRRYFGPVRSGWAPRTARVGGYAMVLALIAAKSVKDRLGSKLGAYFPVIPPIWALQIVLLLIIAAYVAGLLILTSRQRVRLARGILPTAIGFGAVTAGVLYPLAPLGVNVDPNGPSLKWWGLAALMLPLATGFLAARLSARDTRPAALGPAGQSALAASCATATAALLLAVLTSATIALFPRHVPLQTPPPPPGGGCETCDPNQVVIPPGLRHEYWAEISVGQAGETPLAALLIAPFLGAWLGVLGGGLARRSPGTRRRGVSGPHTLSPPQPPGRLRASDANREQVIDTLTAAFAQGRLTKEELDLRAGQTFGARTCAELAALTADLPAGLTRTQTVRKPAQAQPRQPAGTAVVWSAWGLITPALFAAIVAVPDPTPTDNRPIGKILFLVTVAYFIAWLAVGAQMLGTWHQQRSRPGAGRDLMEPGSPAVDE
jgi:Domain of unknown function (DUF1707)